MSAGIVFLVTVQLRVPLDSTKVFIFEATKSALATLLWLWFMLDAAFGPWEGRWGPSDPAKIIEERRERLARGAVSVILLLYVYISDERLD
jgi:hypothetical protein